MFILMCVSTAEELVSSGRNHFYLLQLPYNLHLCSENEPSLPEFGKSKFSLVFTGWVGCTGGSGHLQSHPSPSLSFPAWWFGGKSPHPWLSGQEKGNEPVFLLWQSFFLLSSSKPLSPLLSEYQITEFFHFYLVNLESHDAIWVKALKGKLTKLSSLLPFLFVNFPPVLLNSRAA